MSPASCLRLGKTTPKVPKAATRSSRNIVLEEDLLEKADVLPSLQNLRGISGAGVYACIACCTSRDAPLSRPRLLALGADAEAEPEGGWLHLSCWL